MAKTTDEFGNDIDVGIGELAIGAVCVAVYMLMWAVWFTPFLLMVGLCSMASMAYIVVCNLVAWFEAVYYNIKDSWRD